MTTDTTTASAVAPTPDGHLPCAACGVAVPADDAYERIPVGEPILGAKQVGGSDRAEDAMTVRTYAQMTRCSSCADRLALARLLVDAHPAVTRRIGSPAVATERVTAALDGLAALGAPLPDAATTTGTKVARLVHRLALPGAIAQWASHQRGEKAAAAEVTTAPWAHLDDEDQTALRDAYAALLSDAIGPRPTPPPDDGSPRGCLFCGVGQQPSNAWEQVNTRTRALGSTGKDERVSGYLCGACADEAAKAGAIGPTARERSLLAHLGVGINPLNPAHLDGVSAWYLTGRPPSRTRWAHVALDDETRDALGID